ncbi:MAG: osmotically inducible protein OsmC [Piscirickettsiaceae bacterium]|nr:MAG: osmotically inducible protein OsmC [Piscirickettsiaceae bacterium]
MEAMPHLYSAVVSGKPEGSLTLSSKQMPGIDVSPPEQFGGPSDEWSPEELLMASLSSCLVLSFRAIAKFSTLEWSSIDCESNGTLDKVERKTQFTSVTSVVKLVVTSGESVEKAKRLLQKAEESCFISNSLACDTHLDCDVIVIE